MYFLIVFLHMYTHAQILLLVLLESTKCLQEDFLLRCYWCATTGGWLSQKFVLGA